MLTMGTFTFTMLAQVHKEQILMLTPSDTENPSIGTYGTFVRTFVDARFNQFTMKCHSMIKQPFHGQLYLLRIILITVVTRGCGGECRHDNSVAKLTVSMSIKAAYHDAVGCIRLQLMKYGVAG